MYHLKKSGSPLSQQGLMHSMLYDNHHIENHFLKLISLIYQNLRNIWKIEFTFNEKDLMDIKIDINSTISPNKTQHCMENELAEQLNKLKLLR